MNNTRQAVADMLLNLDTVYVTEHKSKPIYMKVLCSESDLIDSCMLQCSFSQDFVESWEIDLHEAITGDSAISYKKVAGGASTQERLDSALADLQACRLERDHWLAQSTK